MSSSTPRTVKQQARALAVAEGIPYTEARRRILSQHSEAEAVADERTLSEMPRPRPRSPQAIECPHCGAAIDDPCVTGSGSPSRSSHRVRRDEFADAMRTRPFAVRIKATDARLGVQADERYRAQLYWLDPGKITLLERIPDGHDPESNQYWADVDWLGWVEK